VRKKTEKLLRKLLEKTEDGEVDWEETVEEDAYRIGFKDGLVSISKFTGSAGEAGFRFTLRNAEGKEIESGFAVSPNFTDQVWGNEKSEYLDLLRELYSSARDSALNTVETLDSMLQDLEKGKTLSAEEVDSEEDDIPF
jgi:hypothetical protein